MTNSLTLFTYPIDNLHANFISKIYLNFLYLFLLSLSFSQSNLLLSSDWTIEKASYQVLLPHSFVLLLYIFLTATKVVF